MQVFCDDYLDELTKNSVFSLHGFIYFTLKIKKKEQKREFINQIIEVFKISRLNFRIEVVYLK